MHFVHDIKINEDINFNNSGLSQMRNRKVMLELILIRKIHFNMHDT